MASKMPRAKGKNAAHLSSGISAPGMSAVVHKNIPTALVLVKEKVQAPQLSVRLRLMQNSNTGGLFGQPFLPILKAAQSLAR